MQSPGFEPGSLTWQARIIPNYTMTAQTFKKKLHIKA